MLLPFDTIERTVDFDERANELQLRPWQWEILLAADGRTRVGEIARLCGVDFEIAAELVRESEHLGLVAIVTLSLEAYRSTVEHLVTPVSAPASLESRSSGVASDEARKPVSFSFDSFSTLDDWETHEPAAALGPVLHHEIAPHDAPSTFEDAPVAFAEAISTNGHASHNGHTSEFHDYDTAAESPLLNVSPVDFDADDDMAPRANHATHFSISDNHDYGDLFAEPQAEDVGPVDDSHLAETVLDVSDVHESDLRESDVRHALDAHADSEEHADPEEHAASTTDEPIESTISDIDESVSTPLVESHGLEQIMRDPFAPLPAFVEPRAAPKTVSFSLGADAFGLPNVPAEPERIPELVRESLPESVQVFAHEEPVSARTIDAEAPFVATTRKDDVLLQHFGVNGATPSVPLPDASGRAIASDPHASDDLTNVLLRVFGLKK